MKDRSFEHVLRFGIELEMAIVPNPEWLANLDLMGFDNTETAHAPNQQGGSRDKNRQVILDSLVDLLKSSRIAMNDDEIENHSRWTISQDPGIQE